LIEIYSFSQGLASISTKKPVEGEFNRFFVFKIAQVI
jgi:hypothetical protein